jgi:hypothetical protein
MFKIFNPEDVVICIKASLIISITFFILFLISAPAKASNIEVIGCDVGFDGSSGKPKTICTNPLFTREEMRALENM